jgi:pimeloyl-ACP methyl ester carboxylesterase
LLRAMHSPFSQNKRTPLVHHLREDTHYTRPEGYHAMMDWYQRGVSALAVQTVSRFVETRFGLTHVLTAGDPTKPPLLLVHGINVNALNWRSQLARLSSDYYILAPDVPGYAGRSGAWRLSYFTDDYPDWLADVLDAFEIRSTAAAGSSGGGHFLLKLAAVYPERVLGLVLTNPCGIARFPLYIDLIRYQAITHIVGHVGRAFFGSPNRARFLAKTNASPGVTLDPATIELAYLLSKYFRRQAPPGPLTDRQMAQINAPVLLLLSQYEPYFNITTVAREAQRKLRHAPLEVLIVPNAGHDLHNDQPDVVAGELRRWLAGIYSTIDADTTAPKAQTPRMQARP